MRVLISAGEASGDHYGAGLARALRRQWGEQLEVSGLGGSEMRQAGCDTVVDAHDIAVVGITEVVSSLPRIRRGFHRLLQEAERRRPAVAVLIDFPDFNLRLAKQLHRRGIPVVYFVSPQMWAWRSGRVKQIQRYVSKMIVIFPFEVKWFRERGIEAEYVGYPLADERPEVPPREQFAAKFALDPLKPWIALLPGSRRSEAARMAPRMAYTAALLGDEFEYVVPVAPSLEANELARLFSGRFLQPAGAGPRHSQARIVLATDARAVLAHARAAVVASGTATVQAALAGTPFVMVYRVAPSSYALGRWMVRVANFAMPNLIAGRRIVPELVQGRFTAANVVRELRKIIPDGPERSQMVAGLAEVRARLSTPEGASGAATALDRAATAVLQAAR
ncbi:MAG TPA: lipid-A-disaccharide synthase [Terriglobales bacterium]|nr:lipid-A-disaccharide synthase [Terriglobales bacterium]